MYLFTLLLLVLSSSLGAVQVFLQDTSQESLKRVLSENKIEVIDAFSMQESLLMINGTACLLKTVDGLEEFLEKHEIPYFYPLKENAVADSSDFVWIDENTLAVGIGWHTNLAAFKQLENAFDSLEIELRAVFLPFGEGEMAAPHLQSLLSVVDNEIVVFYPAQLPLHFVEYIETIGLKSIEISECEFKHLGANIFTMGPKCCLMLEGCPQIQSKLEEQGFQVLTFSADSGPTSLIMKFSNE